MTSTVNPIKEGMIASIPPLCASCPWRCSDLLCFFFFVRFTRNMRAAEEKIMPRRIIEVRSRHFYLSLVHIRQPTQERERVRERERERMQKCTKQGGMAHLPPCSLMPHIVCTRGNKGVRKKGTKGEKLFSPFSVVYDRAQNHVR